MAYRDLLVHLDASRSCLGRIKAAIALATAHDAHLTALYVLELTPRTTGSEHNAQTLADETMAGFRAAAEQAGVRHEARLETGFDTDVIDILATHGRYADLFILGQYDPAELTGELGHLPQRVVLGSGRPSVIVPFDGPAATVGDHPLVAWDASREAARAVADALPILERAKAVKVVCIDPKPSGFGHGSEPGADIALHLARHGIDVEVQRREAAGMNTGTALLTHAAEQEADLLIMGGYGHSRLRELILGGATRTVLEAMTVPILMAH